MIALRIATLGFSGMLMLQAVPSAAFTHFFPKRPAHVKLHMDSGVLLDYGIGNDTGEFTIRRRDGKRVQYTLAYPTKIDGRVYSCRQAPVGRAKLDPNECTSWPANVITGETYVYVRYWITNYPETHVSARVSDTILTRP